MVLLDIVRKSAKPETFVAAHFQHNVRDVAESEEDVRIIAEYCRSHGLRFELGSAEPGTLNSEAAARSARYAFLQDVAKQYGYKVVMTAHHAGDALETAIINILRGTGPRGLVALSSTAKRQRPLLNITRKQIEAYAALNHISWHEDSTNSDELYLRNYIRRQIVPRLSSAGADQKLYELIREHRSRQAEIDELLEWLQRQLMMEYVDGGVILSRARFINLDYTLSCQLLHFTLSQTMGVGNISRNQIAKLVVFLKTGKAGKVADIDKMHKASILGPKITLHCTVKNLPSDEPNMRNQTNQ